MTISAIVEPEEPTVKPTLICLEGAAGVGKTTLCAELDRRLRAVGIRSNRIAEFSASQLGQTSAISLARFAEPNRTSFDSTAMAESDFMLCFADKFTSLCSAFNLLESSSTVHVCDRGFITQAALALPYIQHAASRTFALELLRCSTTWMLANFHVETWLLQLPFAENAQRLERRLNRPLTSNEAQAMRTEISIYEKFGGGADVFGLNLRCINASPPAELLAEQILARHSEMLLRAQLHSV